MLYSKLFGKTVKSIPSNLQGNHALLYKGGFIRQISAGYFTFLPLGFRVWNNIYKVIQEEMEKIGCQQIITPTLHPIEFWKKTNRDKAFGEEMLVVEDHRKSRFALGATAEGMMVEIVNMFNPTYKDLPIIIYQFSNKFRDEKRPRGGLLRVREFMMKDAYTFAKSESESIKLYEDFFKAYLDIAKRIQLEVTPALSVSGAIGGDYNHEFMVECEDGESVFYKCASCGFGVTEDYVEEKKVDVSKCPKCGGKSFLRRRAIEWAHVFKLDHFYSKAHGGFFVDRDGSKKLMWMGSYGIGIGRTMAAIVEVNCDEKGLIWPKEVAPYEFHLIYIEDSVKDKAFEIYKKLKGAGKEVLFDDREDVSAGEKFADCDLVGIPLRVVVSEQSLKQGGVEIKERKGSSVKIVPFSRLLS